MYKEEILYCNFFLSLSSVFFTYIDTVRDVNIHKICYLYFNINKTKLDAYIE